MSDEQDKLKLSLEPPKLFGRKKKSDAMGTTKRTSPASDARRRPTDEPVEEPVDDTLTETPEPAPRAEPVDEPETDPVGEAAPQPVTEPIAEPETAPEPDAEPERPEGAPQKAAAPAKKATPAPGPRTKPAPKPGATSGTSPRTTEPTSAEPSKKPARPRAKMAPAIEPEPVSAVEHEDAELGAHDELPLLPLYPAAAASGAVVGLAMVILTWLSLRGCEAVRGTASCGGGPGFFLLVATFVLCILLGSTLLKTFSIPDPGSSSFLAVGLVAVVALLFLIDALDHWAMLIVIPLVSVGGFLASVWVTKTFVEPGEIER